MKSRPIFLLAALVLSQLLNVSAVENFAVARAVRGSAQHDDGKPLKVGQKLGEGAVVSTSPGSVVDLFLGPNGPVIRLTENTEVKLVKLQKELRPPEPPKTDTILELRKGTLLGNTRLQPNSTYIVRIPKAEMVAADGNLEYKIYDHGDLDVIQGNAEIRFENKNITVPTGMSYTAKTGEVKKMPSAIYHRERDCCAPNPRFEMPAGDLWRRKF